MTGDVNVDEVLEFIYGKGEAQVGYTRRGELSAVLGSCDSTDESGNTLFSLRCWCRCSVIPPPWMVRAQQEGGMENRELHGRQGFLGKPLRERETKPVRHSRLSLGRAEGTRGACNEPPLRGLRTGKLGKMYAAMI